MGLRSIELAYGSCMILRWKWNPVEAYLKGQASKEAHMSAITWTSAFSALARNFSRRRARIAVDLDRLSARDLADLNLPSDVRAGLDLRRELYHRDRIGF